MDGCDVAARQLPPCIFDPLHLNLLFCVIEIVRKHTERTVSKQQINLLERELLRFLNTCCQPRSKIGTAYTN
jgi:hypothetical protein